MAKITIGKRQMANWEKTFAIYVTNERLLFLKHKELFKN